MTFTPKYKKQFIRDIKRYSTMKKQIEKKVLSILEDPYHNTEALEKRPQFDLRGLRSKRIDRNFRIIFSICEECRKLFPDKHEERACKSCDPDFSDKTVIFFTVRPHKIVYKNSKPLE